MNKIQNDSEQHEEQAVEAVSKNLNAVAQVHATLAVAEAINRLADSADADSDTRSTDKNDR